MKKITTITFLFLLGFSVAGQAQINKLKNKAKSVTNSVTKPSGGEVAKDAQTILKIEKEADEFVAQLEALYGDVATLDATSDDDLNKPLFNLKQKVSTLENYYPASRRKGELRAKYEEFKAKEDAEMEVRETMSDVRYELKSDAEWVTRLEKEMAGSSLLGGVGPRYERFSKNVAAYKNTGKNYEDINGYITVLEKHYQTTLPSYGPKMRDYLVSEALKTPFSETDYKDTPKGCIKSIDHYLEEVEELYAYTPDGSWIDPVKKELNDRKDFLQNYIDSGAFDKYKKEEYQKLVDGRRMYKPASNDAKLIAIVKEKHTTAEYGAIKRIVLLDSDWSVKKNEWGLPIEKYLRVQVATTKDGVCEIMEGRLFQQYEGGGQYGNTRLSHYGVGKEINCDNVNK